MEGSNKGWPNSVRYAGNAMSNMAHVMARLCSVLHSMGAEDCVRGGRGEGRSERDGGEKASI